LISIRDKTPAQVQQLEGCITLARFLAAQYYVPPLTLRERLDARMQGELDEDETFRRCYPATCWIVQRNREREELEGAHSAQPTADEEPKEPLSEEYLLSLIE